jgi:hypothetical protein
MQRQKIIAIVITIIIAIVVAIVVYYAVKSDKLMSNNIPAVVQVFDTTAAIQTDNLNPTTDIYIGNLKLFNTPQGLFYNDLILNIGRNDKPIGSQVRIHNSAALPQNPNAVFGSKITLSAVNGITIQSGGIANAQYVLSSKTAILQKIGDTVYNRLV